MVYKSVFKSLILWKSFTYVNNVEHGYMGSQVWDLRSTSIMRKMWKTQKWLNAFFIFLLFCRPSIHDMIHSIILIDRINPRSMFAYKNFESFCDAIPINAIGLSRAQWIQKPENPSNIIDWGRLMNL